MKIKLSDVDTTTMENLFHSIGNWSSYICEVTQIHIHILKKHIGIEGVTQSLAGQSSSLQHLRRPAIMKKENKNKYC